MIASVSGTLAAHTGDTLIVQTESGIGYAVAVPQSVLEQLPAMDGRLTLWTELVVREDAWTLYGFSTPADREIFHRLLGASGFGPKLALALMSALGAERTVRSIQSRDLVALSSVAGIGKKKAERLVLELADRFGDVALATAPRPRGTDDAVQALVALGYTPAAADDAVRAAIAGGTPEDTGSVIRRALQQLTAARGGR